ncbi:hypothetical protein COLO4_23331 [Corchorus olitorius]|uniref:Uncharacterized protein n=1 Tax=Corchorus olitorius TaxID=93759 RepID=A0A1R3IHD8_9ROSI|nr:hypothetical protein COLO4_23331 [Corchorus olitorius]
MVVLHVDRYDVTPSRINGRLSVDINFAHSPRPFLVEPTCLI